MSVSNRLRKEAFVHDVVIVGAGPVGLFLACELGLGGCSVLVLEREPEPRSPWKAYPLWDAGPVRRVGGGVLPPRDAAPAAGGVGRPRRSRRR
ncbi:FAD-dependent monooxygenase [Nonomuraea aurantiaca]|uniref:FAD-dependent monooxygenase n=1 Tax=Nonomuraea aurantiaca TaxID=2878562 RepID=UPI001CDA49F3|nr:FAD-dependent monooxygenase [Nonomuraea aurantiaca]MCA2225279.1 FAD-dependent monooxygenase [Nonomuraea aurantiaca]